MTSRSSFATTDIGNVEQRLRARYGGVRLTSPAIQVRDDLVLSDRFFLGRLQCSGSCLVEAETRVFTVAATTGTYRWEVGDERGEASSAPFLIRPGRTTRVELADTVIDGVTFDTTALRRTARTTYADERVRIRFGSSAARSPAYGRVFGEALAFAVESREFVLESELLAASVYRHLATAVLECFDLDGDRDARSSSVRSQLAGYRRARVFIDDFASLPITVEDIADASRLSVVALRAAFRTSSPDGRSPSGALRQVRLDAAHRELVEGDPTLGSTVRDIALRWGFTPSGFARHYRSAYGATPKRVLDR